MQTDVDKEQLKEALREVLAEQTPRRVIIRQAVHETLAELGVDHDSPLEMQKDFQHLREARTTMEAVRNKGVLTILVFLITGFVALISLGVKTFLNLE